MNARQRVVLIGAGGNARVVLDVLRNAGECEVVGLLDPGRIGETIDGVPVLGGDELLNVLPGRGIRHAIVGVGAVGDNRLRMVLFERVCTAGFEPINAIHPRAVLSNTVRVGSGVAIMAGVVVNAGSRIGDNVVLNTGAIIEHDCAIESHAQVAPGAVLCGGVRVGIAAYVGAGATVRQGISIGEYAIVAAGAVVVRNVAGHTSVFGVPAREKDLSELAR